MTVESKLFDSLEAYGTIFPETVEVDELLQLSRGEFTFAMEFVHLDDVTLEWNRMDTGCRIRERYLGDGLVLGFLFDPGAILLEGVAIDRRSVLVWSCGRELDYATLPGAAGLVITLSGALLARLGLTRPSSVVMPISEQSFVHVVRACRQATAAIQARDDKGRQTARMPSPLAVARDRVLSALLPVVEAWDGGEDLWRGARSTDRWSLIKRAEALMHEGKHGPSIDAMARLLDVPRRTLFHAFRTSLGVGPYQLDRIIRLHQLRQALLEAAPEKTRVTDLAVEHGFSHLGRLSTDYRAYFGESPSSTLARR